MTTETVEKSLTNKPLFYNEWHSPRDGLPVNMVHHHVPKPISWYVNVEEHTPGFQSENSVSYTANSRMQYLKYMYMRWKPPTIRVKAEFRKSVRIAWSSHLGHNIVSRATFRFGGTHELELNARKMDVLSSASMKPGFRQAYLHAIGERPELTRWASELATPLEPLEIPQPWYFSRDSSLAYPLFMDNGAVIFSYEYQNDLTKVLRMQKREEFADDLGPPSSSRERKGAAEASGASEVSRASDEAGWVDCPFDMEAIEGEKIEFKYPGVYLGYGKTEEKETRDWTECKIDKVRFYNVRDVLEFSSNNSMDYGTKTTVEIKTQQLPIRSIHFLAENTKARELGCYSNYSCDSTNAKCPLSACQDYSLTVANVVRAKDIPCSRGRFMNAWLTCQSPTDEEMKGIFTHSFVDEFDNLNCDISAVAGDPGAQLVISLDVGDRTLRKKGDKFNVYAYPVVYHLLEFRREGSAWKISFDAPRA